jgi:hypothetical protein
MTIPTWRSDSERRYRLLCCLRSVPLGPRHLSPGLSWQSPGHSLGGLRRCGTCDLTRPSDRAHECAVLDTCKTAGFALGG